MLPISEILLRESEVLLWESEVGMLQSEVGIPQLEVLLRSSEVLSRAFFLLIIVNRLYIGEVMTILECFLAFGFFFVKAFMHSKVKLCFVELCYFMCYCIITITQRQSFYKDKNSLRSYGV